MSLVFSDTVTYKGIVQEYEREAGFQRGDISGNANRLKELTTGVNIALDDFTALAIQASGTWQYDDSNYDDYPIISGDLIAGQRDYVFTSDEGGNLILDVAKVMICGADGIFRKIDPIDVESQENTSGFYSGQNATGTPTRYDKLANGIFLDPPSNYSKRLVEEGVAGIKMYVNRESQYFSYTDTTKMPGVPGIFHRYFALKPALDKARRDVASNFNAIQEEISKLEDRARLYFGLRSRDERKGVRPAYHNNH